MSDETFLSIDEVLAPYEASYSFLRRGFSGVDTVIVAYCDGATTFDLAPEHAPRYWPSAYRVTIDGINEPIWRYTLAGARGEQHDGGLLRQRYVKDNDGGTPEVVNAVERGRVVDPDPLELEATAAAQFAWQCAECGRVVRQRRERLNRLFNALLAHEAETRGMLHVETAQLPDGGEVLVIYLPLHVVRRAGISP